MNIDVSNLKALTAEAIKKGKEQREAEEKSENAAKMARDAKIKAEADEVIAHIPGKCEKAAKQGLNRVLVMEEKNYSNYKSSFIKYQWRAEITDGPGLIVIEACRKSGLNVSVKAQDDGVGMRSWAEIWVSWD